MIPVARPALSGAETAAVGEVLESRWLGQGRVTAEFEAAVSNLVGDRAVLAVNTGTTAMHLALELAGVGVGDDVVLPSLTFVATTQAVVAAGANPVFCDVNPETLNVDLDCLKRAMTPRTRAVMPVHYRGLPVELDTILAWARERGVRVIEDAAHAFGSEYADGTPVGGKGDLTCFSFDPIKNVTTGEGGAIVFADSEERERAACMAVLGIDSTAWGRLERKRPWEYDVTEDGFRYHMPNLCAAIGLTQLEHFDRYRARKQEVLAAYQESFVEIPGIELRPLDTSRVFPFLALVLADDRDEFMAHLKENGVGSGVHYIPSHHFSRFRDCLSAPLSVTDDIAERIVTLPLHSDQSEKELATVIDAVTSFARDASPV